MEEKEVEIVESGLQSDATVEAGLQPDVNQERLLRARMLIENINTSMYLTLSHLKQFRDEELYKDLAFNSMEDFCNSGRLLFGYATAKKFLLVADKFGTDHVIRQLSTDNDKMETLVRIANDPTIMQNYVQQEGIVKMPDGSEVTLKELTENIATSVKDQILAEEKESVKDLKKESKRLASENKNLAAQVELQKSMAETNHLEAAKWRETATKALGENIDIEKFALLNTKEGAIKTIVNATEMLTAQISLVNEIPESMEPTIELIALANTFSASLKAIQDRFLEAWNPYFFSTEISGE
ncbi:MAG TPA: hypothetical protein PK079_23945 [Leptospiraceae bacterium]|nr:hypothetical protein [Leptospiraceae bacterium]HMW08554.1 hypothetical protein [Leptospiraceae bacterium]HMZ66503.1 hypothetical protein [Leptospiraceae bacterium]HNA10045.1 hypothetical protein [Leptospiraceae bacterium]HNC00442.1 hypothetical protein [Leptospiraceae bacterium]